MYDFERKCLLCFNMCDDAIEIFGRGGRLKHIPKILSKHFQDFWSEISEDNIHSKVLCLNCWQQINSFHQFYCNVKKLFQTYSIKFETDSDYTNLENVPSKNDGHHDVQLEQFEIEIDEESQADDDRTETNVENTNFYTPAGEQQKDPDDDKDNDIERRHKKVQKKNGPASEERKLANKRKIQDENDKIREFFNLKCEICSETFDSFLKLRSHYRDGHDVYGYVICCKKKLYRRCYLLEHIDWHSNPAAFTCEICHRTYKDKAALKQHKLRHNPSTRRNFICERCNKEFFLKREVHKHILLVHSKPEDKKFICDVCDKRFILKSMLSSHIRYAHQTVCFQVCDICAKTFKNKYILKKHRETHGAANSRPNLECRQCGALMKSVSGMRSHRLRHLDIKHTCEICGKISSSQHGLYSHMRYVHKKRTLKCTICDKALPTATALREHTAAHTGQPLYNCPYCIKMFVSGANMHKHKKRVHYEQWHQDRQKRLTSTGSAM